MRSEARLRRAIVRTGRVLVERGLVVATDGNISARLDGGLFLATPSGRSKGSLGPSDLVVVAADGRKVRGRRRPSSELGMHLAVYARRPDAEAVIHAHPPVATGFACAGLALEEPLISEVVMGLGKVPLAPYATTGTPAMAEALSGLIGSHDAALLANHGVVVLGSDLEQAFWKLETVEQFARVTLVTRLLGRRVLLPRDEIGRLRKAGEAYFRALKEK